MARLPFDPSKMSVAKDPPASAPVGDVTLRVSELAARIDGALRGVFPAAVRVVGEISGFRDRTHWYFDLKDEGAVVSCAMWQGQAKKVGFTPSNGQQVVVRGRLEFYAPGGKVTLVCDRIEPVGAGALELAYRALLEEIRGLGWTAVERKRAVPRFPRKVAVVTSRSAAALQDVLVTMRKRCCSVGVVVADVRVQGQGAAAEVAGAIRTINLHRERLGVDAILVTRGGGSMEDLWAFNDKELARAIVESELPVVAAIGHETDTTIAELVADERCATPTQAAMRLTPDGAALGQQIESMSRRLAGLVRARIETAQQHVTSAARSSAMADPHAILERLHARVDAAARTHVAAGREMLARGAARVDAAQGVVMAHRPKAVYAASVLRLEGLEVRMREAWHARVDAARVDADAERLGDVMDARLRDCVTGLAAAERHIAAVNPNAVLERGYTLTRLGDGTLVREPRDVGAGAKLRTTTAKGDVWSVAEGGGGGGGGGAGASGESGAGAREKAPAVPVAGAAAHVAPAVGPADSPAGGAVPSAKASSKSAPSSRKKKGDDGPGLFA
jgi:exodeoxyribonuclease VII large subunit